MVVDAAFLTGTIASFMMNGACCMYQLNREDELREELRRDIRREWHQQRKWEVQKQRRTKEEQKREFEKHYQRLLAKNDDQSYTHTHQLFGRTSPPRTSPARRSPDPPSVATHVLMSRNSSILDGDDEEEEEEGSNEERFLFVSSGGSKGTLEDVSVS